MTLLYTWYPQSDGTLSRRGQTSDPPIDTFIHRVTEPDETNTGTGIIGPLTQTINTNVTILSGQTIENATINGHVTIHPGGILRNCRVRGSATPPAPGQGSSRSLVQVIDHDSVEGGTRAQILFCDIEPQTKSGYWTSCLGPNGYYVYRTRMCLTTDILGARASTNQTYSGNANVRVEDCWLGPIIQWDPDPVTPRSTAYKGTHNDTIQLEGNTGTENDIVLDGCTFVGRMSEDYGQPSSLPQYWTGPVSLAVVVASPNVRSEVNAKFIYSWCYGGAPNCFNLGSDDLATSFVVVEDCKFERPGAPGVPALYPGKALVMDPNLPRRVARNTYIDNGAAVSVQGG